MRRLMHVLAFAGALLAANGAAMAAPADFVGIWTNTDPSGGIVKLVIKKAGSGLEVQTFGACSPTPCDWGFVPLVTYGNNVSDTDHKYGTARYDQGFATRNMTFELIGGKMELRCYSQFAPGDGRQNYRMSGTFTRRIILLPIPLP